MPTSTATYDTIASFVLTQNTQSISFSNIPQNYQTIVLSINGKYTNSGQSYLRFTPNELHYNQYQQNSYSLVTMPPATNVASFSNSVYTSRGFADITPDAGTLSLSTEMTCVDYNNASAYKTVIFDSRSQSTVGGYSGLGLSTVSSDMPLYNFTFNFDNGTFTAGTSFALYGLSSHQIKATGGDIITCDGTYWYHAFKSTGVFTPVSTLSCDVLVVAGGGGGGYYYGAGAGAGGVRTTSLSISTAQNVTVGAGGAGATGVGRGTNGTDSTISTLTSTGGGAGGGSGQTPNAGGSGGGAHGYGTNSGGASSPATSPVQGYAGGNGVSGASGGAGGGGATAVGGNGISSPIEKGGDGGAGTAAYSSWVNLINLGVGGYVAGGGGGAGGGGTGVAGLGGAGGGGNGSYGSTNAGGNGFANTGSGGGGIWNAGAGGMGGSGLVIVRYAV